MSYQIIPLSKKSEDLSLQIFGRLLAIAPTGKSSSRTICRATNWLCVCCCGNMVIRKANNLKRDDRHSCGCLGIKMTHGLTGSPAYKTWQSMVNRCHKPFNKEFINYGQRGITVCDSWRNSFASFYKDMGDPPKGKSLDRIDNNGPYSPDNCRWANQTEQCNNKRTNKNITYKGITKTIAEWARHLGISPITIRSRLRNGWSTDKSLESPVTAAHCKKSHRDTCSDQ